MRPVRILYTSLIALFTCMAITVHTQPARYSVSNAHSHNDYVNEIPFYTAYGVSFGSIEADIFLFRGRLLVGHDSADLTRNRTLEQYYLRPLDSAICTHKGRAYADATKPLNLLIDVKNAPAATLDSLIALLKRYPALITTPNLRIVITGNRPDPATFYRYPGFIWFDGLLSVNYTPDNLSRVALISENLRDFAGWKKEEMISPADAQQLQAAIDKAHKTGKTIRFWNAPDNPYAWKELIRMKADYINTDHILALAAFLENPDMH